MGTLCGVELGLGLSGVPIRRAGVESALAVLAATVPAADGVSAR
jgi:hypothetical protein